MRGTVLVSVEEKSDTLIDLKGAAMEALLWLLKPNLIILIYIQLSKALSIPPKPMSVARPRWFGLGE